MWQTRILCCLMKRAQRIIADKSSPASLVKLAKLIFKAAPGSEEQRRLISEAKALQTQLQRLAKQKFKAESAVKKFRATAKKYRNTFQFINTSGKLQNQKGKKGFLVYINTKGKKQLIESKDFKLKKISSLKLPGKTKAQVKARKLFRYSRLELTGKVKTKNIEALRAKAQVISAQKTAKFISRKNDFDPVVKVLGDDLSKVFKRHKSKRRYVIEAFISVKLPEDNEVKIYEISVDISKADHIAIDAGGVENFLRQKFYAELAQQLAFDGYVTTGSANHVRKLPENFGKEQDEWTKAGIPWQGRHDTEQVLIKSIQWRILQQV